MFTTTTEEEEANKKKIIITLKSSDGELFQVDEAVAVESETIKPMIINDYCGTRCADNEIISLPNVTSKILSKVIEYCKKHVEAAAPKGGGGGGDLFQKKGDDDDDDDDDDEDLKKWDAEFVKKVKKATLFDLLLAANYLNIKSLSDLTCLTVANMIRGKTPEEIRTIFNLTPDDQEEEE